MNPYQPGEDNQDPYEVGYKAGAASRDAEIAELTNKVKFLSPSVPEIIKLTVERDQLRAELVNALAACKAKDEALLTCQTGDYSTGYVIHPSFDERLVKSALAIQPDDSALEAIVKKAGEVMREECITAAGPEDSYQDDWIRAKIDACDAIRAIPAVTLEDLK